MKYILSTAYLPPVEYMALIVGNQNFEIEKHENFIKQTYRNRTLIPTANNILALTIPIKKNGKHNCPIEQIEIDYSQSWQQIHWRALEAAYNASPYFLFYKDNFQPFFIQKNIKYLFDFNYQLLCLLLKLFDIQVNVSFTQSYSINYQSEKDFRNIITPKQRQKQTYPFRNMPVYQQVFMDRKPFEPNMSCIDLLFNEGRNAKHYLKNIFLENIEV